MANKYVTFGSVVKRQDGKGSYIKVFKDVTLTKGMKVGVETPVARAKWALENGHINEDQYNERVKKAKEFNVQFELTVKLAE